MKQFLYIMSKKIIILVGVVMCVVVSAGIFYWNAQNQEPEAIGSPSDYVVVESEPEQAEQGRYVENEKAGLKVRIPDGWTEEKMDVMEGSMVFYSPDMESMRENSTSLPLKKGCMIEVAVGYEKTSIDKVKREVEESHNSLIMQSEDKFEMVEISGIPALKSTFDCLDFGHSIEVYVSTENILYVLAISSGSEDIEKCSQEFDGFLENIVIE